jgi:hypothetical protein
LYDKWEIFNEGEEMMENKEIDTELYKHLISLTIENMQLKMQREFNGYREGGLVLKINDGEKVLTKKEQAELLIDNIQKKCFNPTTKTITEVMSKFKIEKK